MRPRPSPMDRRGRRRRAGAADRHWRLIGLACWAVAASGCEEVARNVETRPQTRAPAQTGINVDIDVENPNEGRAGSPKPSSSPRPQQSGPIIGQRTTDIRDAAPALKQGGAKVASTRIVAKDPITIQGNAYVSIVGRSSVLNIQHAMDLYKAANDRFPKDYDEFMAEIIKANNIALPQLPPYQAYGYDDKEHKLILLEYPDKK